MQFQKNLFKFITGKGTVDDLKENDNPVEIKVKNTIQCDMCGEIHVVSQTEAYEPHSYISDEIIYEDGVIYLQEVHKARKKFFYAQIPLSKQVRMQALVKFCELWFQNKSDFEFDTSHSTADFEGSKIVHKPSGIGFRYFPRGQNIVDGVGDYEKNILKDVYSRYIYVVFKHMFAEYIKEHEAIRKEKKDKELEDANNYIMEQLKHY